MKRTAFVFLSVLMGGCATVEPYPISSFQPGSTSTEHRFETNYQIGVAQEAFVGESMVQARDFFVTETVSGGTSGDLAPTQSFTMTLPPLMFSVNVAADTIVPVVGTTEREGNRYRIVMLPGAPLRFLITDDGSFEGSAISPLGERMGFSYLPKPMSARLVPAVGKTNVQTKRGSTNFELVYGGTSKDAFQVTYREYTENDLARPAFMQNLVYDKDQSVIRFKNLQIEVRAVSNQKISFVVVSDGAK